MMIMSVFPIVLYAVGSTEKSTVIAALPPDVSPSEALTGVLEYIRDNITPSPGATVWHEWKAFALARGGVITETWKNAYLAALNSALNSPNPSIMSELGKTTTKERIVLALTALGINVSKYGSFAGFLNDINNYAASGTTNERIFGLLALNSMPYKNYRAGIGTITQGYNGEIITGLIKAVLDFQHTDGGWVYEGAPNLTAASDTDMTAMAIQSLAPYYRKSATVQTAIDRGLAFIKNKQDSVTGGFIGANGFISTCSSAQVVTALAALGIDAADGSWDVTGGNNPLTAILQNYDKTNKWFGEYDQLYDSMATEQAAYALAAYDRLMRVKTTLYDMSDVFGSATGLKGDINGDGYVDYNDFLIFLANYGKQGAGIADTAADINGDSYVDYNDFLVFLSNYGKSIY